LDTHLNINTTPLARVPAALLPCYRRPAASARPAKPTSGLSPFAETALDNACRAIIGAPDGAQETTLNGEVFAIGTLAGAGAIPSNFARRALIWAARRMPDYDPSHPWRAAEIERKVNHAFDDGMRSPRMVRRA
jgi:hypothetical protein